MPRLRLRMDTQTQAAKEMPKLYQVARPSPKTQTGETTMKTQTKVQHTPTPWSLEASQYSGFHTGVINDADGRYIGEFSDNKKGDHPLANAAFLIRAVNCHAELVSQLNLARDIMAGAGIRYPDSIVEAIAKAESL